MSRMSVDQNRPCKWKGATGLALVTFALGACLGAPEIEFRVCGDPAVPGDVDALRMSVLDQSLTELHAGLLDLVDPDTGAVVHTLPLSSTIRSGTGGGWARIEALLEGIEVIVFARRVGDLETADTVDMPIKLACRGVTCPLGQTCVEEEGSPEGHCVLAPSGSEAPICPGGPF